MPSGPRDTRDLAAAALASGSTVRVAADAAGVSETTIHRWKREDPDFVAKIHELRSAAIASALGLLAEGMASAATALVALVRHRSADTKLRAAVQVLTLGLKLRDAAEIEQRIAAIEAQLRASTDGEQDHGEAQANRETSEAESEGGG